MIVMGANWCHDSRAFLDLLADPGVTALTDTRYHVERVDVGWFDHVRGVVDRWDVPVIYGTPTVLVVEPRSNTLLNQSSLAYWRNAATLGPQDVIDYFSRFEPGPVASAPMPSPALAAAFDDIDRFERAQAERIYRAYAVLGPMLRSLGEQRPDEAFMEKWNDLAEMRSEITADLAALRDEARELDAAGVDPIRLSFPDYDLFID
jgi:hypothetical protein